MKFFHNYNFIHTHQNKKIYKIKDLILTTIKHHDECMEKNTYQEEEKVIHSEKTMNNIYLHPNHVQMIKTTKNGSMEALTIREFILNHIRNIRNQSFFF